MSQIDEDIQFDEIIRRKQYQIVCILLERDVNYYEMFSNQSKQPLLHTLLIEKQIEIAHYILNLIYKTHPHPIEKIDQPNQVQQTPLMLACYYGLVSVIRHLIKLGANVNLKDQNNFTPLLFAIRNNQTYVVIYLVFKGADLFSKDLNGCNLAHWAAYNNNLFMLKILRNLFKFNIFDQDNKQKTPLKRSEEQCSYDCSRYIISQMNSKIDYHSTNKFITYLLNHSASRKRLSNKSNIKRINQFFRDKLQMHLKFILSIICNVYMVNIFVDHNDNWFKHVSLISSAFNIFLSFIFFYIIENCQQVVDACNQPVQHHSSLSFSNDIIKETQGCLEIDQTDVPLIQEDHNYNQSLSLICENILEIDKPFIRYIVQQIDTGNQVGFEIDQVCLECMIVKIPKSAHCRVCNQCHPNFQLRSTFYMKCISDDWVYKFYILLLSSQAICSVSYLSNSNQLQQRSEQYLETINYDFQNVQFDFMLIFSIFIAILFLHQLIYLLILLYSIISQQTLYEMMNGQECWYKYRTILRNGLLLRIKK